MGLWAAHGTGQRLVQVQRVGPVQGTAACGSFGWGGGVARQRELGRQWARRLCNGPINRSRDLKVSGEAGGAPRVLRNPGQSPGRHPAAMSRGSLARSVVGPAWVDGSHSGPDPDLLCA